MARFRIKNKWTSVLAGILVVAMVFGAVMGISAIFKKDTRTIGATSFSVGALNDKGQVQKYDQAIISDYFECQGLTIEPDDNATGAYQVFYYTDNKNFVGKTDKFEPADGIYKKGDTYPIAKYARVMITPSAPVDEDGIEETFRIRFYEISKYAGEYTVSVNKKQTFLYPSEKQLLNSLKIEKGKSYMENGGYEMNKEQWLALVDKNVTYSVEAKCILPAQEIPAGVEKLTFICDNSQGRSCYTQILLFDADGKGVVAEGIQFDEYNASMQSKTVSVGEAKYFAVEGYSWNNWYVYPVK